MDPESRRQTSNMRSQPDGAERFDFSLGSKAGSWAKDQYFRGIGHISVAKHTLSMHKFLNSVLSICS